MVPCAQVRGGGGVGAAVGQGGGWSSAAQLASPLAVPADPFSGLLVHLPDSEPI